MKKRGKRGTKENKRESDKERKRSRGGDVTSCQCMINSYNPIISLPS